MLFSVVIPTYNRADLLPKCLDSLVAQTYKDFEVLICDNGSTDNTNEVVDSYSDRLKIRYNLLEGSGSPARPRNHGIRNAKGEWICLLDSDDWWTPDKLATVSRVTSNYDFVFHPLIKTDGEKSSETIGGPVAFDVWEGFLVFGNPVPNSSVCFRRNYIEKVGYIDENPALKAVEDADFWLRMMKAGARFLYFPQAMGFYYWKPGVNLSTLDESYLKRNEALLAKHLANFSDSKLRIAAQAYLEFRKAQVYFKSKRWRELAGLTLASAKDINGFVRKLKFAVAILCGRCLRLFS